MIIRCKVKLYSKEVLLDKISDNEYIAHLTKIPEKGKANDELMGLLSKEFGVSKADIKIKTPMSRKKIVEIID